MPRALQRAGGTFREKKSRKKIRMRKFLKEKKGWILVGALLLLAAVLLCTVGKSPGKTLVITKDGKEVFREEMREGIRFRVEAEDGYNLFEVEQDEKGELYVICTEADCPEQVCVNKGPVKLTDDPIVCLPHRVTARLVTGN